MLIEQLIIFVVLASLPVVALFAKRGAIAARESVEAFTVGDRRFKMFRIGAGISMAFVGGAATLNMASLGYQYGWSVVIDPIVVFVALLIAAILAGRVRAGRGITLTDALAGSSPALRRILALAGFVVYQLLTASQFVAIGKLLGPYFQGLPIAVVIAIPAIVVFAYTYLRGFQAVTNTDVLQLLIMLALYAAPCLWVFATRCASSTGGIAPESPAAPFNLLIYLALPLLFVPVSFDTNIRVKAAASLFQARAGLIVGGLQYVLFLLVSIGIGVFVRHSGQVVDSPENVLPQFFQHHLGSFSIIGTVAVLAAIVSTLDSMAFDTIVAASNDVLGPARTKGILSDRKALAISSFIILAVAMLVALVFQQILGLVLAALLLYVSVFIPVAVGRWIRTSDQQLVVTSLATCAAIIGCKIAGYTPPLEPVAFLAFHLLLVFIFRILRK
jgi:Na+/proline symporter